MDLLEKTLEHIKIPLVLDVATGSGSFAGHLRTEYRGIGTIIGIDVSMNGLVKFRDTLRKIDDTLIALP